MLAAFGVVVTPNEHGIPDVHSTFVYVLDRAGRLSRTLLLSTGTRREILTLLAAERPNAADGGAQRRHIVSRPRAR
jgi:hypothetical protein